MAPSSVKIVDHICLRITMSRGPTPIAEAIANAPAGRMSHATHFGSSFLVTANMQPVKPVKDGNVFTYEFADATSVVVCNDACPSALDGVSIKLFDLGPGDEEVMSVLTGSRAGETCVLKCLSKPDNQETE